MVFFIKPMIKFVKKINSDMASHNAKSSIGL
jgi:hypothetical protein